MEPRRGGVMGVTGRRSEVDATVLGLAQLR